MKLAWILWMAGNVLPQPAADSLCLSTTVYLEARDQSVRGQQAVAEVALRRRDSGLWGRNLCQVVTARKQFAPTIVSPQTRLCPMWLISSRWRIRLRRLLGSQSSKSLRSARSRRHAARCLIQHRQALQIPPRLWIPVSARLKRVQSRNLPLQNAPLRW